MDDDNAFRSAYESRSVLTIIQECKNSIINLDATYQRDIVWDFDKKSKFINSIVRKILPMPLIFNIVTKDGTSVCVDGKQRISSIIEFSENKFSSLINDENLYYTTVPKEYHNLKNYRAMTNIERNKFNSTQIQIVSYENLSPSDERDIFQRIQFGVKPTQGELIPSLFKDEEFTKYYKNFCSERVHYIKKFIKQKQNRGEELEFISLLIYCLAKETYYIPTKPERDEYIMKLNKSTLNGITKKLDFMLENTFKQILCDGDITRKINKPLLFVIAYVLNDHMNNCKKIDYEKCLSVLIDTLDDCNKFTVRKTKDIADKIKKIIDEHWNNY